jgi:hypothetical protein
MDDIENEVIDGCDGEMVWRENETAIKKKNDLWKGTAVPFFDLY